MANSEDRKPDAPGGAADAAPVKPTNPLRIVAGLALLAGLFAAGLCGSWGVRENFIDPDDPANSAPEPIVQPAKKSDGPINPAEALERGDQALALHRFARALSYYDGLLQRGSPGSFAVTYRVGLCQESLGQLDDAQAAYRKAIGLAATPAQTVAGHLGLGRCLLRRHHGAAARLLLVPLVLSEGRQGPSAPLAAGARFLVALALADDLMHSSGEPTAEDDLVSFDAGSLEIPNYLDDLGPMLKPAADKKTGAALTLRKQADPLDTLIVSADEEEQPVRTLLDRLITAAGLHAEWTAEAEKQVDTRSLRLAVGNRILAEVVEQAADHFDLVCEIQGETVRLATAGQMDGKAVALARQGMTRRALRSAFDCDAGHAWAPAALLELGILEASAGQPAKATIWFERLVRIAPASPQAAPACFNLGQLHAKNRDFVQARQAWFRVIDRQPGHELALRAYLRIAQSHLEDENPKEAIVQLRRAQNFAPGSAYRPVAALLLAAAYLQKNEPENARHVLARERPTLVKDAHKPMAVFLDAYAEYRLAKANRGGRREAADLLNTLWPDLDGKPLGPVGAGLVASAYYDLGFCEQAEKQLRRALEAGQGSYTAGLEFLLARTLWKQNRHADAVGLFQKLAATRSPYRDKSRFQLAQIDLDDKNFVACEAKCRQIWSDGAGAESAALLRIWGGALEGMGEYGKAAKCFAGKAPD